MSALVPNLAEIISGQTERVTDICGKDMQRLTERFIKRYKLAFGIKEWNIILENQDLSDDFIKDSMVIDDSKLNYDEAGTYYIKAYGAPEGAIRVLPYLAIGIGCGLFGHGFSRSVSDMAIKSDPAAEKRVRIEENDERNNLIANKAKGRAFDMMTGVYGALMVAFGIMGVDMIQLLLMVFAYLIIHGAAIYYRIKFEREM